MIIDNNVLIKFEEKDIIEGKLVVPEGITIIADDPLSFLSNEIKLSITHVSLPKTLIEIGNYAFSNCNSIEEIKFPDSIKKIGDGAFTKTGIKKLDLPKSLQELGEKAFHQADIEEVVFNSGIECIKEATFLECFYLQKVTFKEGLKYIGSSAFGGCFSLSEVNFPNSLEIIEDMALSETALEVVFIGENIKKIKAGAFALCQDLRDVEILGKVQLGVGVFLESGSIQSLIIPSLQSVEDNVLYFGLFDDEECPLQKMVVSDNCNCKIPKALPYMIKENGCCIFSKNVTENSVSTKKMQGIKINVLGILSEKGENLLKELNSYNIKQLYNYLVDKLSEKDFKEFIDNKNIKFFKRFSLAGIGEEHQKDFIKLYYNLGGFNQPVKEVSISKRKNEVINSVDYAQIVGEFLLDKFANNKLKFSNMHQMFESMKFDGFKPQFAKFFLDKNNFELLMQEEQAQTGFIARCYNEFEKVQQTHTSNRGAQRQLQATVEYFKKYFNEYKFPNVTDDTRHIADTIAPYFSNEETFEKAVEIDKERQELKTADNILSYHLKETDVFEEIDNLAKKCQDSCVETLNILTNLANKKFTYDWLEKKDPANLILGKLCSCCAHLEGAGYGIMHASIVHPDVQNLVIRDKAGVIVAKSTLYINRKEGYGVFNNIEVSSSVEEKDKNEIYNKYIEAVNTFAKYYNQENPTKPLKVLTVGMNLNDLEKQIIFNGEKSKKIYKALDYRGFGIKGQSYNGDSSENQYVIWKQNDENIENN